MEKELKDALITIAEYMQVKKNKDGLYWVEDYDLWCVIELFSYDTSADALLPVWRKLRDNHHTNFQKIKVVGKLILFGDYPAACIELAEIIKQLK